MIIKVNKEGVGRRSVGRQKKLIKLKIKKLKH